MRYRPIRRSSWYFSPSLFLSLYFVSSFLPFSLPLASSSASPPPPRESFSRSLTLGLAPLYSFSFPRPDGSLPFESRKPNFNYQLDVARRHAFARQNRLAAWDTTRANERASERSAARRMSAESRASSSSRAVTPMRLCKWTAPQSKARTKSTYRAPATPLVWRARSTVGPISLVD